jgi:hypothetical protein
MVKIKGTNNVNSTLLLNGTAFCAYEAYIDSKSRLWIGVNDGYVVYN